MVPAGVTVAVAYTSAGELKAMTCSSLTSVSVTPPTLSIALDSLSATARAINETARFAVYLLSGSAVDISKLFAMPDSADKMTKFRQRSAHAPSPALDALDLIVAPHAYASTHCLVAQFIDVGSHRVFFGQSTHMRSDQTTWQSPLLLCKSEYTTIGGNL